MLTQAPLPTYTHPHASLTPVLGQLRATGRQPPLGPTHHSDRVASSAAQRVATSCTWGSPAQGPRDSLSLLGFSVMILSQNTQYKSPTSLACSVCPLGAAPSSTSCIHLFPFQNGRPTTAPALVSATPHSWHSSSPLKSCSLSYGHGSFHFLLTGVTCRIFYPHSVVKEAGGEGGSPLGI